MIKKIICLGVVLIICLGILYGCGDNPKIDIGGEIIIDKPSASCQVRVMLDNYSFCRKDNIKFKVGFGFRKADIGIFLDSGAILVLNIDAKNFIIINEENIEYMDLYEKEYNEYSDSKFVCTKENKRYVPNYYEIFDFRLIPSIENDTGTIQISITNLMQGSWEGNGDGQTKTIYYAANSEKIAFSSKSIEDAQKKLK